MVDSKENYKFDLGFKELTIMNFLVGDKFLYSCDSKLRYRSEITRRNKMWAIFKGLKVFKSQIYPNIHLHRQTLKNSKTQEGSQLLMAYKIPCQNHVQWTRTKQSPIAPLIPMSDQDRISPYIINTISSR